CKRRHTISKRDWSSDVCSSDLFWICYLVFLAAAVLGDTINYEIGRWSQAEGAKHSWSNKLINKDKRKAAENFFDRHGGITIVIEIGRESCREREWQCKVALSEQKDMREQ